MNLETIFHRLVAAHEANKFGFQVDLVFEKRCQIRHKNPGQIHVRYIRCQGVVDEDTGDIAQKTKWFDKSLKVEVAATEYSSIHV